MRDWVWDWIFSELKKIERKISTSNGVEKEDIIQNVCLYLCQNPKVAESLYETKNVGTLYIMVRHEIYDARSKQMFSNKVELSRYQRIISVCEKYGIEPRAENAYKIYALIDSNKWNDFSISGIVSLLSAEPLNYRREQSCGDKIEDFTYDGKIS